MSRSLLDRWRLKLTNKDFILAQMIDVAIEAAKAAGDLALRYFKNQPKVTYKSDRSPVTRADIEAEKLIRKIITKKFPDHGIIGEELPPVNPQAKYQWVIDPIDGTRDFAHGLPTFSTLVAVLGNNTPIVGVCYYPKMNELFVCQKGQGAHFNGKRTRVSKVKNLDKALITYYSLRQVARAGNLENFIILAQKAFSTRDFGAYSLSFLLRGQAEVYIDHHGHLHDFAAPAILVTEAGGKFTDLSGEFLLTSGNALATNGLLHSQVLKILNT